MALETKERNEQEEEEEDGNGRVEEGIGHRLRFGRVESSDDGHTKPHHERTQL